MKLGYENRRSRKQRHPIGAPCRESAGAIEVLRVLNRYRYLRSTFIAALTGRSRGSTAKHLKSIFHETDWVDRPARQFDHGEWRAMPAVYEITEAGRKVLRKHGQLVEESPLIYQARMRKSQEFWHDLMVCDLMASVELGLRDTEERFVSWQEILERAPKEQRNPFSFDVSITDEGRSRSYTLVPDGLFGIERPDGTARYFALEADRNNEPGKTRDLKRSSFYKKLLGYRKIAKQKLYQHQLGLPNLLVLTVTINDTHMHNLMKLTEYAGGPRMFLFASMPLTNYDPAPKPTGFMTERLWQRHKLEPVNMLV